MAALGGVAALTILSFIDTTRALHAQQPVTPARAAESSGLEVLQLRPNFYVIIGAGGNIAVQTGEDGVVVVDAGSAAKADVVVAAIKALWDKPIRYVIDTSADADHVGGNEKVAKAGRTLFNINNAFAEGLTNGGAAAGALGREGVDEDERADRRGIAVPGSLLADGKLRQPAQIHVSQRGGHRGPSPGRGAH